MQLKANLSLNRGAFCLRAQLDIPLTGITALFGASGSGKTTLLRCIAGLERASGELIAGEEIWQHDKIFRAAHRRHIGMIFQEGDLFAHLSARENLLFGFKRLAASARRLSPDEVIDLLQLESLLSKRAHQLSGGERQRVALGRSVLASPKILLMDEPLAALDQPARLMIYPFLRTIAMAMKIPIIYVSHSIDEVARLAHQIIFMDAGKISAVGETGSMLTRLDLPMAQSVDAEAVITGVVAQHDPEWQLTHIAFNSLVFRTPMVTALEGGEVRLRIVASDVSISLSQPLDSSVLNVFSAKIESVVDSDASVKLLKLNVNGAALLARITRASFHALELKPGSLVFAQIKGAAVLT